jgi:tetraacyldisaccharide 4'-kinase
VRGASLVRRWWAGEAGAVGRVASLLAWPLELVFRTAVAVRNRLYHRGVLRTLAAPIPVLAVGNLTVGGTGKTPVAAWLVRRLAELGRRPALVARGYGRDELLLHARWNPSCPVIAAPDRIVGVRAAAAGGADVAVLDDGFQHRRLGRDADVVLLAAETPFPGRLLPRGPYREPAEALGRAALVVVTRKAAPEARAVVLAERLEAELPGRPLARAALLPAAWQHLDGTAADPPRPPLLVATAVAEPETVLVTVRAALARSAAAGAPVPAPRLKAYPDHHAFDEADVAALARAAGAGTLIVTEKDAVKLEPHASRLPSVRVLALELRWEAGEDVVEALLARVAGPTGVRET